MKISNVLFLSTSNKISGAEISLLDLMEKLDSQKFKCFVVTNLNPDLISRLPAQTNVISLKLIWFKKSFNPFYILNCVSNVILNTCRLTRIIEKNKIQVIYANTTKACIYGIFVKLCTKTKLVWHVRDNVAPVHFTKILKRYSDRIICVSRYIYDQINCAKSKKQVINTGIDIDKWDAPVNSMINIRDYLNLKQEVRLVAQIAQITKWKNHKDFIEVAEMISQQYDKVHFIIVGECISQNDHSYKNSLLHLIEIYNLGNRISFLGWVDNMAEIYNQTDLVLFPSIREPLGRVVIEAMAMGKYVIAYDIGGPHEIIENGKNGILVPTGNWNEMASQAIKLLKNEERMLEIGINARKHVLKKFNIQVNIRQIEDTIDSLT